MKGWTSEHVKQIQRKQGLGVKGMEDHEDPQPQGKIHIENILYDHDIVFVKEYRFSKRRFRADYFVKDLNLLIEYEGLGRKGDKNKMGGHQTLKGFTSNCTKYNLACTKGFRLLRYTALNFEDFENDLINLQK